MLDAPGYPNAFLEFKNFKIEIYGAKLKNKYLNAKIKIFKKSNILVIAAHPDDEILLW